MLFSRGNSLRNFCTCRYYNTKQNQVDLHVLVWENSQDTLFVEKYQVIEQMFSILPFVSHFEKFYHMYL